MTDGHRASGIGHRHNVSSAMQAQYRPKPEARSPVVLHMLP